MKGRRLLRAPSSTRPAIWLLDFQGQSLVVKDFRNNRFLYRNTVGRFLLWREEKAYRRLRGLEGIPPCRGRVTPHTLILEVVDGVPVEGLEHTLKLSPEFFTELRTLVDAVHARGLVHCDLKRAPNILLGRNNRPYIVDWSAAIAASEFRPFPLNLIYQRFLADDLNAVVKLQLRHCPEALSRRQLESYEKKGPLERLVRRLRDRARDLLKRLA